MGTARLLVDLGRIAGNAAKAAAACRSAGAELIGVTKGVCGMPEVARAMLAGGVAGIGDARLDNIRRMREAGIAAPMTLLRSAAPSEVPECVALADASLNADLGVLRALAAEALRQGKRHAVTLMVDLETGREGLAPGEVAAACREVASLAGLALRGLGAYFDYRGEDQAIAAAQARLVALAREAERETGVPIPVVSGGSTSAFRGTALIGKPVPGVNQLRVGTAILLGISSSLGPRRIEGYRGDTFVLEAELIETKRRGDRRLGLLSLGELDAEPPFLYPVPPGVKIVRASSDHTVLDLTDSPRPWTAGDRVPFLLGYYAMSRLTASRYVRIEFAGRGNADGMC